MKNVRQERISFGKLLLIPLAFFVKDIIATFAILSREPGITANAVHNYALALLPGTFFVVTGYAIPVNLLIGFSLSVIVYVILKLRPTRLP